MSQIKEKPSRIVFLVLAYLFLSVYAILALLPLLNLLAMSFSHPTLVDAGLVTFWPQGFTADAYDYIIAQKDFFRAFGNSILRVLIGVPVNVIMAVLVAYPLSRPSKYVKGRNYYVWFFFVTMIFSGGMVPGYMLVSALGLKNSIFSLILPGAVPIFNVILLLNFFRQIPEDLYEAARLDGANEYLILWKVYVPLSIPAVMTTALFMFVNHWNSWFDGLIYMSTPDRYPLQTYLQAIVVQKADASANEGIDQLVGLNQKTVDAARLFLAVIPVTVFYLIVQKYLIKGLTMGGVKG